MPWPNHALQRTRLRVTARAFLRLSLTAFARARPAPRRRVAELGVVSRRSRLLSSTHMNTDKIDYRERWTHEDHLINHRLTWLLASQTLLFAAYGLLLQQSSQPGSNLAPFLSTLATIGKAVSWLIAIGIFAALIAMLMIKRRSNQPDVSWFATILGWVCAFGLPILFILVWSSVPLPTPPTSPTVSSQAQTQSLMPSQTPESSSKPAQPIAPVATPKTQ